MQAGYLCTSFTVIPAAMGSLLILYPCWFSPLRCVKSEKCFKESWAAIITYVHLRSWHLSISVHFKQKQDKTRVIRLYYHQGRAKLMQIFLGEIWSRFKTIDGWSKRVFYIIYDVFLIICNGLLSRTQLAVTCKYENT